MHLNKIKAIIFDIDGVVFKSIDENGKYLWSKNLKKDLKLNSEHCKLIYSKEWNNVTKGKISTVNHLQNVFSNPIFKNIDISPKKYIDYWLKNDQFVNKEIIELIKLLSIDSYIGTNQDYHRTEHIKKLVGSHFKYCFSSFELKFIKPEKRFYSAIEKFLNLKSNQILLIDDTYSNIVNAKKQGWETFFYNDDINKLTLFLRKLNLFNNEDSKKSH